MAPNSSWYFAYGSNLSREQFRSRAGQILEEITGQLKNYELRFNKKMRGGSATANVQQSAGKTVHGVLYRIPESAYRNLDRYEGAPEHYRRIELRVTASDGREINAQVYIATKVEKGLRPTPHYLQTILDGAAEHGMPAEYVQSIRAEAGAS
jgi:gamma-glutamylcyclotransferase